MFLTPQPLHLPDGFLHPGVAIVGWVLAALLIALAIRQTRKQLGERQIPLMGVLAAFIFAAQAINFPVATGTSGHLLGGALAAIAMGPWAATLIMTAVIAVQGLLFQDGGLLVMGWNILNMGILTAFGGYAVYALVRRLSGDSRSSKLAGAAAGAWVSVEIGAIATAIELAVSGTSPLRLALPAMASVHALIGIGESFLTAGAVAFLLATRPEVLGSAQKAPGRASSSVVLVGLMIALGTAAISPLASPNPDGLEAVAERQGFLGLGLPSPISLLPDYLVPGLEDPTLATILAVGAGALVVFAVAWLVGRATRSHAPSGK